MINKSIFLASILITVFCSFLSAQINEREFHHISINAGLSQSTVQTIHQDSYGFMWFGTQDGLNRYNGFEIETYFHESENPNSLSDNNISVIYEDREGTLWIGTRIRGLNRFDRTKNEFISYLGSDSAEEWETLSANTIWTILEDSRGTFWVGTGYGLNIMNREQGTFNRIFHDPTEPTTISDNYISVIYEDREGTVWIGTGNGLNRLNYSTGDFTRYLNYNDGESSGSLGIIRSIYQDRDGTLWVGTENQGLFSFDKDKEQFIQYVNSPNDPTSLSGNAVFSILEDQEGYLWIGTGNDGINIYDKESDIFYRYQEVPEDPYSINNNGINCLFESREGIMWAGTFAGGVNFHELRPKDFHHYKNEPQNPQSLNSNIVQAIYEGGDGNIWIGTDGGGLSRFDPQTETFTRVEPGTLEGDESLASVILDIHETKEGLWMATYGNGVQLFNTVDRTLRSFKNNPGNPQSISSDYVFDIFESRDGHLWFSTNWGGVTELNPETEHFVHYQADGNHPTLSNNDARVVFEDSKGELWIGVYDGYVERLNRENGSRTTYNLNDNGNYYGSVVQTIFEDRTSRIWFATRGKGLMYLDRDNNEIMPYLTRDQQLPSNVVHAITEDSKGNLWLSTNNGLTRFNPQTSDIRNFNIEHGLHNREFLPGSAFRSSNGYMYFGGVNGFNRFHPDSIRMNTNPDPVVFTEFLLYNKPVTISRDSPLQKHITITDELILPYDASVITLGYAALNYSASKGNEFAYMLEGFDENWNYVGRQRRATYTNLSPGEYKFMVRASNNDGLWSDAATAIRIIIEPPFWKTYWFIVLMVIFTGLAVTLLYRLRVRHIRTRNIILEQKVRQRTLELQKSNQTRNKLFSIIAHDLRNYASSFVGLSGLLKESALHRNMDEITEYSTYLNQAANQFIDFLKNLLDWARAQTDNIQCNPENIHLEKTIEQALLQAKTTAKNKHIEIDVDIPDDHHVFADPNLLSIVVYNLVNNAIKFSEEASMVEVKAGELGEESVEISVRDYGLGMSKEIVQKIMSPTEYVTTQGTAGEKGTGLGFSLCKDFVQRNNGTIHIESEEGYGTKVIVILPSRKSIQISTAS